MWLGDDRSLSLPRVCLGSDEIPLPCVWVGGSKIEMDVGGLGNFGDLDLFRFLLRRVPHDGDRGDGRGDRGDGRGDRGDRGDLLVQSAGL